MIPNEFDWEGRLVSRTKQKRKEDKKKGKGKGREEKKKGGKGIYSLFLIFFFQKTIIEDDATLRGDLARVTVGKYCLIGSFSSSPPPPPLSFNPSNQTKNQTGKQTVIRPPFKNISGFTLFPLHLPFTSPLHLPPSPSPSPPPFTLLFTPPSPSPSPSSPPPLTPSPTEVLFFFP